MTSILQRNKNLKKPVQKTREEYAEDALYREVWEDVNNEKTQQFVKKYWKYIVGVVVAVMVVMSGVQIGMRMHRNAKLATASIYESALNNGDAAALANLAKNSSGATADLAMFQSYIMDKDVQKLEFLLNNAYTRDFRDLARLHLAAINGDKMGAAEFEQYLSGMDTKKSPFFYTSRLMIAQKYLADGNREMANKFLDLIIKDADAPESILVNAQMLK